MTTTRSRPTWGDEVLRSQPATPKWLAITMGVIVASALLALIFYWATWMADREEAEFQDVCDRLGAEFVSADGWKCIKGQEIVYP